MLTVPSHLSDWVCRVVDILVRVDGVVQGHSGSSRLDVKVVHLMKGGWWSEITRKHSVSQCYCCMAQLATTGLTTARGQLRCQCQVA
jgi:hypothetical protein